MRKPNWPKKLLKLRDKGNLNSIELREKKKLKESG